MACRLDGRKERETVTADEQLERLAAELDRLKCEHPGARGILRLTNTSLRSCSKWKWEKHGWAITDGEACGIMNGDDKAQRTALLSILKLRRCAMANKDQKNRTANNKPKLTVKEKKERKERKAAAKQRDR